MILVKPSETLAEALMLPQPAPHSATGGGRGGRERRRKRKREREKREREREREREGKREMMRDDNCARFSSSCYFKLSEGLITLMKFDIKKTITLILFENLSLSASLYLSLFPSLSLSLSFLSLTIFLSISLSFFDSVWKCSVLKVVIVLFRKMRENRIWNISDLENEKSTPAANLCEEIGI
jgi:hypothetical protein